MEAGPTTAVTLRATQELTVLTGIGGIELPRTGVRRFSSKQNDFNNYDFNDYDCA
jgi:hypothetical protein